MGIIQEMDWSPLWLSLKTGVAATLIAFIFGILIAERSMRMSKTGRAILDGFLTLPLVLPPTATGFFLLCLFSVHRTEMGFGIQIEPELVQSWKGCLIAAAVIAFPLMYRNARESFEQVDENLIYTGRTLGMSETRLFWKVIFPSGIRGIMMGSMLAFMRAVGEYGATAVLVQNTLGKTRTIPLAIAAGLIEGNISQAAIMSIGVTIVFLLLLVVFNIASGRGRKTRRWI